MKVFLLIFISLGLLVSCGDSKYGASNDPIVPANIDDLVDPFADGNDKPEESLVTEHCKAVVENRYSSRNNANYFVGDGAVSNNSSAYREMLKIGGVCLENGWTQSNYGNYYNAQYSYNLGTSNCSYWDQNFEITLGFESTSSTKAGILIKTTGDGFPAGWGGQGFPTEQLQYEGFIDCTKEDLTINALSWNQNTGDYGYVTIVVPNEYGHKNHYSMRAYLFFDNKRIGSAKLNIQ